MKDPVKLVISVLLCEAAGLLATPFIIDSVLTWYPALKQPPFTPPDYVFGPVWTVLYLMMAFSLYLVWSKSLKAKYLKPALFIFYLQLFFNFLWSFLFFTFRMPHLALIDIIFLLTALILTILKFRPISVVAAWLLVPYLIWVSFATYLNLGIILLNY